MQKGWRRDMQLISERLDARVTPLLSSAPPLERAFLALLGRLASGQPERRYLRKTILPALARAAPSHVLFAGVRFYTAGDWKLFDGVPTEIWTCDADPEAAAHGAPDRHLTDDLSGIDAAFPPGFFDTVVMNGPLSGEEDARDDIEATLLAVADLLTPGGVLIVGREDGAGQELESAPAISLYEPAAPFGLPQAQTFPGSTYAFSCYRARLRD